MTAQDTSDGSTQWKDQLAKIALNVLPYACSRELSRHDQQHATELIPGFAADICSLSVQSILRS